MYGCNKLYCEHLGRYYSDFYRQLAAAPEPYTIDFRCLRFPGLISAVTLPSGGTSDYAPEMIHAAAQGESYHCFVRPETRIPFMAMPDAIKALLELAQAPVEGLTRHVYNVTSFNPSAEEVAQIVQGAFPEAEIDFAIDERRQGIVDSWPAQVDDSAARHDWDWQPDYGLESAFQEYLIPTIQKRYA
jgi:nucleoside-diphosphate-sugar epimerase